MSRWRRPAEERNRRRKLARAERARQPRWYRRDPFVVLSRTPLGRRITRSLRWAMRYGTFPAKPGTLMDRRVVFVDDLPPVVR